MGKETDSEIIGRLWNDIERTQKEIINNYIKISLKNTYIPREPSDLSPMVVVPFIDTDQTLLNNPSIGDYFRVKNQYVMGIYARPDYQWSFESKGEALQSDGHMPEKLLQMYAFIHDPTYRSLLIQYWNLIESKSDFTQTVDIKRQMDEYIEKNRIGLLTSFSNILRTYKKNTDIQK